MPKQGEEGGGGGGVPGTLARERVLRGGEGGREAAASPHVGLREVGISG